MGPLVNNPGVEHGALINLLGVDTSGSIPELGWRLVDPNLPQEATPFIVFHVEHIIARQHLDEERTDPAGLAGFPPLAAKRCQVLF